MSDCNQIKEVCILQGSAVTFFRCGGLRFKRALWSSIRLQSCPRDMSATRVTCIAVDETDTKGCKFHYLAITCTFSGGSPSGPLLRRYHRY